MGYILKTRHHNTGDNLSAESYCSGAWSYSLHGDPTEQLSMGLVERFYMDSQLLLFFYGGYFSFPRQKFYSNIT